MLGFVVSLVIFLPQNKKRQQEDEEILKKNLEASQNLQSILAQLTQATSDVTSKRAELADLTSVVKQKRDEADSMAKDYYDKALHTAELEFDKDLEKARTEYEEAKSEYSDQYISMLKDLTTEYNQKSSAITSSLNQNQIQLENLQKKLNKEAAIVAAAVEANKRTAEMENKAEFYKLQVSNEDKAEMAEIRKCFSHLRNPEPLNKVIWKVYYEKPTTDLIGRVIGAGTHTGIYKITNTLNGMTYVGQSVNLADRWKQHIKRGIGADEPTKNKLYPAMLKDGVENFSFEVIEECPQAELNEKEKFWTDYFKAQEFGYSIRKG